VRRQFLANSIHGDLSSRYSVYFYWHEFQPGESRSRILKESSRFAVRSLRCPPPPGGLRMKRAIGSCIVLATTLLGCSKVPSAPSVERAGTPNTRAIAESRDSWTIEHDLGLVLAHDQPIRHVFPLSNPTNRPIRLLRAEVLVPCCSAVEQLPESIPPGGHVEFPVIFHPGDQSGRRRVAFTVETDNPSQPILTCTLAATPVAEVEVRPLDGSDSFLPLGRSGTQRFTVFCRRKGEDGLGAPDSVVSAEPLAVSFVGPAEERLLGNDWIETTRTVEVTLPPAR
jgi:hypothetical protein